MGSGASVASSLAPTGLAAAAIVCPPAGLAAGAIFGVGVAVGAAWGGASSKPAAAAAAAPAFEADAAPAFDDALDAVVSAAEAVAEYLRAVTDAACAAAVDAAVWALEKLEAAAAFVLDRVVRLLRRMRGRKEAAAARREMRRAAAARRAGHDVYADVAECAARVARSGRCIMGPAPAASSAIVVVPAAAAAAGALALRGSVSGSDVARRAARSAAGMMGLILEAFPAEADLGDSSIPAAARSSITIIAAAAAVCLDVVASTDVNAQA